MTNAMKIAQRKARALCDLMYRVVNRTRRIHAPARRGENKSLVVIERPRSELVFGLLRPLRPERSDCNFGKRDARDEMRLRVFEPLAAGDVGYRVFSARSPRSTFSRQISKDTSGH